MDGPNLNQSATGELKTIPLTIIIIMVITINKDDAVVSNM